MLWPFASRTAIPRAVTEDLARHLDLTWQFESADDGNGISSGANMFHRSTLTRESHIADSDLP